MYSCTMIITTPFYSLPLVLISYFSSPFSGWVFAILSHGKKTKTKTKTKKTKNNNNNEKTAWSYHWIPLQTFMVKFQTVRCVELFEKRGGGKESSLRYLKTFQLQGMKREQTSCHVRQKAWGVGQGCRPWEGHSSNPSLLLINKWEGLCCA